MRPSTVTINLVTSYALDKSRAFVFMEMNMTIVEVMMLAYVKYVITVGSIVAALTYMNIISIWGTSKK